ncbi:MAG: S46 family peptidase [Candidatus Aminicenantes bacterium]|nr:S46 family peptidase [Candidatus Aminicenantes bacterium]
MKKAALRVLAGILLAGLAVSIPAASDEGMWLFNMAPKDLVQKRYGFALQDEWLTHLRLSSVRFGGASASFVSSDGLVLTNHHVGRGAIQNLSSKDRDLMKTGFYARTRPEEIKCPGVELRVLEDIVDVTETVTGAVRPGMSAADAAEAIDKAVAALEKEESERSGLRASVVKLYSGSLFHLYKYKTLSDVRLVFAPENAIAFFGGDADNFTYPRYDLDIALFRVYENDRPLKTPHYLKWSSKGVRDGELVFCSGNPGSTGRLLTLSQLEFLRDTSYPFNIANLKRRQALLHEYAEKGEEEARVAMRSLFGIENGLKATLGYQSGLLDKALMDKKAREEKAVREAVAKDVVLSAEFGKAWDEIAAAQASYASFFKPYTFLERAQGFNTVYFGAARTLVRLAQERAKPNAERLREYRDANLASVERSFLSPAPIYDEFEVVKLADSLAQLNEELGHLQEVRWLLGGRTPDAVARELVAGTKLADIEARKALLAGGWEAVCRSEDAMIKLALLVDPVSRGLRSRYEKEVDAVETRNGTLVARALFRLKGATIPPDATSTLRLSFGVAKGYLEHGRKIPYATTFAGLFALSAKNVNRDPYTLPPSFVAKKSSLDLSVPLNFVSTCDSIGGNSGSPLVNRKAEFVGVLFDGNIQSLPTRFVYDDTIARSVMVDSRGILEALLKVYDAKPLVDEILGRR